MHFVCHFEFMPKTLKYALWKRIYFLIFFIGGQRGWLTPDPWPLSIGHKSLFRNWHSFLATWSWSDNLEYLIDPLFPFEITRRGFKPSQPLCLPFLPCLSPMWALWVAWQPFNLWLWPHHWLQCVLPNWRPCRWPHVTRWLNPRSHLLLLCPQLGFLRANQMVILPLKMWLHPHERPFDPLLIIFGLSFRLSTPSLLILSPMT